MKASIVTAKEVEAEQHKAIATLSSCAKMTALSALLDLGLHADMFDWVSHEAVLASLYFGWKCAFAVKLWQVTKIYSRFPTMIDVGKISRSIEALLDTLTVVWRVTALMVGLTAATQMVFAWKSRIENISGIVSSIVVGLIGVAIYVNSQETGKFAKTEINASGEVLRRKGFVTVRAMLMCATALELEVATVPILALAQFNEATWPQLAMIMLDIPTPLAISALMRTLRKNFLSAIVEVTAEKNKELKLQPATAVKFSKSQQDFYGKVKSTIVAEIIMKIVVTVTQFELVQDVFKAITTRLF